MARRRHPPQRGFAWLLGLALLLPLAQTVALWHGLTHLETRTAALAAGAGHFPTESGCDLCLTAATLGGGALPTASALLPLVAADHEVPHDVAFLSLVAYVSHYLSRAPPVALA